ncbi:MAG: hypothetical protein AMXMBFR84_06450 [Candidatus Hydrogenedentota bacterium]
MRRLSRRDFLHLSGTIPWLLPSALNANSSSTQGGRDFHICSNIDTLTRHPHLLQVYRDAGIGTVWIAGYFYGHWPWLPEALGEWRKKILAAGLQAEVATVPLGHPGDSLGSTGEQTVPLTPPAHWQMASKPDGKQFSGTSLHEPATAENADALKLLRAQGFREAFLDDDFRLAVGPGVIGGCFCGDHKQRFLNLHGYSDSQWHALLADVRARDLSPIVRAWVEFTCDELTASFRTQQAAAAPMTVSIMVMYLGSEKAGIRLKDYADTHFRVGELMFNDAGFSPVKGKTDELFSALFHRRHVEPEDAFSETTIFPENSLSAKNMAAKLAVSTIADVRHTLFMSGLPPIPESYWPVLAPAIAEQKRVHEKVAGHAPHGPFKHFHGEAERYVGEDKPYSLFLASGIPFEVTGELAADGWTFLGDADARAVQRGAIKSPGTQLISRISSSVPELESLPEELDRVYALKDRTLPQLHDVPVVMDHKPVVCAWYPTAQRVLLWNLSEQAEAVTLRYREAERTISLSPLGTSLAEI